MTTYTDVIEYIIKHEMDTIGGPVALRQARKVPDITITEDGDLEEMNGPGKIVLKELVESYEEAMGPVAVAIIATAIEKKFGDDPDIVLPDILTEHV